MCVKTYHVDSLSEVIAVVVLFSVDPCAWAPGRGVPGCRGGLRPVFLVCLVCLVMVVSACRQYFLFFTTKQGTSSAWSVLSFSILAISLWLIYSFFGNFHLRLCAVKPGVLVLRIFTVAALILFQ